MFSRKFLILAAVIAILIAHVVFLVFTSRRSTYPVGGGAVGILIMAPIQDAFISSARFVRQVWHNYFYLISTAENNRALQSEVQRLVAENNRCKEIELSNERLRALLDFHRKFDIQVSAAEVVARDPSGWFKTVIIDKGSADGVKKRMPVVVSAGVVGQIIDVSLYYSKVLLVTDRNSAVDGLCQRSRARGIVKGSDENDQCDFIYVLRTSDVIVGDTVISSGLDGIYPKGMPLGRVSGVTKKKCGMFQTVEMEPLVDFDRLEEVLVVLNQPQHDFTDIQ
jgi:rod shape-determining protein MreC